MTCFDAMALDCAPTTAGRIACVTEASGTVSYKSLIHLRGHFGSVRAVIDGDTRAVIEANDYYPFGKRISVTGPVTSAGSVTSYNRWLFSGKEDQSFLNAAIPLLDFGARMYNPAIARWTAIDPLSEKNLLNSPYSYCSGNPICIIDPFGKDEWDINEEGMIIAHRQNKDNDVIDHKSYIHTDNNKNGIGIVPMAMDISEKGETVTSIIHSHPNNTIPSGFNPKDTKGDKFAASAFTESHRFPVENYVYQPKNNRLIQYTNKEIIPGALFWDTVFLTY